MATQKRTFTRTDFNFCLDVVLLLVFVSLVAVSVVVDFVFPTGPQADGWRLWGRTYGDWSGVRFANLAVLIAAVLLHVMLHWNWVCGVITHRLGTQRKVSHDDPTYTLWGVGLLILILSVVGVFVAAAALCIESPLTSSVLHELAYRT